MDASSTATDPTLVQVGFSLDESDTSEVRSVIFYKEDPYNGYKWSYGAPINGLITG